MNEDRIPPEVIAQFREAIRKAEAGTIPPEGGSTFQVKEVIKPDPGTDLYVGWSHVVDRPVWLGSRAEAIADGCPPSRLDDADARGTDWPAWAGGCDWDAEGLVTPDGYLPRANLAAYVPAFDEGRAEDAQALLEPWDEETMARRNVIIFRLPPPGNERGRGSCDRT